MGNINALLMKEGASKYAVYNFFSEIISCTIQYFIFSGGVTKTQNVSEDHLGNNLTLSKHPIPSSQIHKQSVGPIFKEECSVAGANNSHPRFSLST